MSKQIDLIDFIKEVNEEKWKALSSDSNANKKQIEAIEEDELVREAKNLKTAYLHVVLFFVYGYFYAKYNKELFCATFKKGNGIVLEVDFEDGSKTSFFANLEKQEYDWLKRLINTILDNSFYGLLNNLVVNDAYKYHKIDNLIEKNDIIEAFNNYIVF